MSQRTRAVVKGEAKIEELNGDLLDAYEPVGNG